MPGNNELAVVLRLVADEFRNELKSSQGAIGQFNDFIKDWRTQLVAVGTALFSLAKSTANFGEEALKGAQKAGTTVQTFSALAHAAHMSDVENQQLILGLKALSTNMVEAQRQTGDGDAAWHAAALGGDADPPAGGMDARKRCRIHAEHVAQLRRPGQRRDVEQHGPAGVGGVGGMDLAAGQVPDQPAVDGAQGQ